jgi:predicted ester cyclase
MSIEENKQLARRFYEEVVNTGNVDLLAEIISPDYVEVHQNTRYPIGLEGARQHVLGGRQTYPDLHLTIERQIAEGPWVVTQVTARGTHQGVWLGMKPTGKNVEMTVVNLDKVIDGRIVEHGGAADLLHPFLEIGAVQIADPVEE